MTRKEIIRNYILEKSNTDILKQESTEMYPDKFLQCDYSYHIIHIEYKSLYHIINDFIKIQYNDKDSIKKITAIIAIILSSNIFVDMRLLSEKTVLDVPNNIDSILKNWNKAKKIVKNGGIIKLRNNEVLQDTCKLQFDIYFYIHKCRHQKRCKEPLYTYCFKTLNIKRIW